MRVLLMGGPGPATRDAAGRLEAAGHDVLACYDDDRSVFPCKGLEGRCPLDEGRSVDVALLVRGRAWPRPTPFDRGVTCAVRDRVPVAVTGRTSLNPYARWTELVLEEDEDLVGHLERLVASAPPRSAPGPAAGCEPSGRELAGGGGADSAAR